MARFLAYVAIAAFAVLVKAGTEGYGRGEKQEESFTVGVQPHKYVGKCEHSKVQDTQLHTMDYAWTVSGVENTFKFHSDQKHFRFDLETEFETVDFPAKRIILKIGSCTNTSNPKLSVAAFYETPERESMIMYKFNVAVKVGQQYLVIPEASSPDFASLKALLYNSETGDQILQRQEDFYVNYNDTSLISHNKVDDMSIMDCEHGIDGNLISTYIENHPGGSSNQVDGITFIFKFTAIEYGEASAAVPMSTSRCGPRDQVLTYETLFKSGYGQVQYPRDRFSF